MASSIGFNYVSKREERIYKLEKGIESIVDLLSYFRLQCSPIPTPISCLLSFSLKITVKYSNPKSSVSSTYTTKIPPKFKEKENINRGKLGFSNWGKKGKIWTPISIPKLKLKFVKTHCLETCVKL